MKNLKLIQLLTMPIKYLPFNDSNQLKDHRVLINMPNKSGKVAQLSFNFEYKHSVDPSLLG